MKKLLIGLLIPLFITGAFVISRVNADNDVDYDLYLGNSLSGVEFDSNTYIETLDKDIIDYNVLIPSSFDKMAEDEELELYLEPETLAIAVRVKDNGYVYSSYNFNDSFGGLSSAVSNPIKSGVNLELLIKGTPVVKSYLDTLPDALGNPLPVASSTIQPITNGYRAKIDFNHPDISIRFDMNVYLDNGSLVVDVPLDSIEEYNPDLWDNSQGVNYYLLQNIVAFQYFGSTQSESDGYVMIPDGSGALIPLDNVPEIKTTFKLDVYGEDLGYMSPSFRERALSIKDPERVTMPVFGVFHNAGNTGFYVIAEEGAPYAEFNFKSKGLINNYYSSYFNFRYRQSYEQYQSRSNEDQYRISFQDDPNQYDSALRYIFLSGTDADYVGMAKSYQEYLVSRGDLGTDYRNDYDETPTKIDFIGTEITQGILTETSTEITTYDEIQSTLNTLQEDGYNELIVSLKTFDMDYRGYRFDVYRKLGGKNDFKDLMEYFETSDIEFSYYIDYLRSYEEYSRQHAQTLSKREIYHVELSRMFFAHLVNDTEYYIDYAKDDLDDLQKYGIENIALAGLDRALYTSWDNRVKYATENMEEVSEMLAYYDTNNINTGMYLPDVYMYKYVNAYYDTPISSSDYSFASASIPFLQLVIGGYMDMYSPYLNFASDEDVTLLRLVEYGVYPSYILSGGSAYDLKRTNSSNVYISEYEILQNRMDIYFNKIDAGLTNSIQKEMIDHTFLAEGVVLVEYDDASQIIINYNNEDVTVNDIVIEAVGYVVIQ